MKTVFLSILFIFFGFISLIQAGGVYRETKHGNMLSGVNRLRSETRGECIQCHYQHGNQDAQKSEEGNPYLLFTKNDNTLCYTKQCHDIASFNKIYQGSALYEESGHNNSPEMIWPGPRPWAKNIDQSGLCINCHDPHGYEDSVGLIPSMTIGREELLCLRCHDMSGPARYDIESEVIKNNRQHNTQHYLTYSRYTGRHDESEGNNPTLYGFTNRHLDCVDCHNPHVGKGKTHSIGTNVASDILRGVSGIRVTNGSGGSIPTYTYISPDSITEHPEAHEGVGYEYQICFKCHSSWAPGLLNIPYPSYPQYRLTDQSREFNPNNRSHHAVEAPGNNQSNHPNYEKTFVSPITKESQIYCSDCHGSEENSNDQFHPQGPHGSYNKSLLTGSKEDTENLCWKCHRQDVYNDGSYGTNETRTLSRFDHGSGNAQEHFNPEYNIWKNPCMNCHGGSVVGGIHGSDRKLGRFGESNLGDHFMNGANIAGFTHGNTEKIGSGGCWTFSGANPMGRCHAHPDRQSWTPNYEY